MSQNTNAMKVMIKKQEEVNMANWTVAFDSTFSIFDIGS